ncbi:MAG: tRNA (guanine(10)-N(2))-dimethyltransferase [Candidatus ainarchaeum sp.]|nr:tRNA (guanine(10)-N(2))-dimethyltransferase [Candidatus ainarchaeum sp.]
MARLSERVTGAAVAEGSARILVPKGVFFNSEMRLCRDFSVLALKAALAGKKVRAVDATAGTGVRGIRYSKEAGGAVGELFLVDVNRRAAAATRRNLKLNGVKGKVANNAFQRFACSDAARKGFGFIELDPFGSPVPFLHDAARLSRDGTILSVTATDAAVLCGAHPKACLKNYQAKPLNACCCHEVGARILLGKIARTASEFNFGIAPLFTLSHKHYFKAFVALSEGAERAVESVRELGFVAHCSKCLETVYRKGVANALPQKCAACGESPEYAGPLWLGRIQDGALLAKILSIDRGRDKGVEKTASALLAEARLPPLYFELHLMAKRLSVGAVKPESVCRMLERKGFACAGTHFRHNSVKTDAPKSEVENAVAKLAAKGRRAKRARRL